MQEKLCFRQGSMGKTPGDKKHPDLRATKSPANIPTKRQRLVWHTNRHIALLGNRPSRCAEAIWAKFYSKQWICFSLVPKKQYMKNRSTALLSHLSISLPSFLLLSPQICISSVPQDPETHDPRSLQQSQERLKHRKIRADGNYF